MHAARSPFLLCLLLFCAALASAETRLAGLNVGNGPNGVTADPAIDKVYVATFDHVSIIDGATNTVTNVGTGASSVMAVNPVTHKAYVVGNLNDRLMVIDGTTNAVTTIPLPASTLRAGIAVDPVARRVYIPDPAGHTLIVYDEAAGSTSSISLGGETPQSVAVHPITHLVYVVGSGLTAVDPSSQAVMPLPVVVSQPAIAINPVTNRIYVPSGSGVAVVDPSALPVAVQQVALGAAPVDIVVNPATNRIYAVLQSFSGGPNNVSVIDGATNAVTVIPTTGLQYPARLALNPITNMLYLVTADQSATAQMGIIDGNTNTLRTIASTAQGGGVAVNPITNRVYVAHIFAGMDVLDGSTYDTADLGPTTEVDAIATNPVTGKVYVVASNNSGQFSLVVIDAASGTVAATVSLPSFGTVMAVNPVVNKVYIANDSQLMIVDGATNAVSTTPLHQGIKTLAVNAATNQAYVAWFDPFGDPGIALIDANTNAVTRLPVNPNPNGSMAFNTRTNKLYIADQRGLGVLDVHAGTYSIVISTCGLLRVAVDEDLDKVFASVAGESCNGTPNRIVVLDGATNATTSVQINTTPTQEANSLVVNRVTHKVYAANNGASWLVEIDGGTLATAQMTIGNNPYALDIDPVANRIYGALMGGRAVAVVDGATHAVTSVPFTVGMGLVAAEPISGRVFAIGVNGPIRMITPARNALANHAVTMTVSGGAFPTVANPVATFTVCCAYSPTDPPVREVYARAGDTYGTFSIMGVGSPVTSTIPGIRPGLNYVKTFAFDAMEATVWNPGAGGSWLVGAPRVYPLIVPDAPTRLTALSTRAQVLTADNRPIAGFIIDGYAPKTVIIRARGPSLTALGVAGALANPTLDLYSGTTVLASNDDWGSASNAADVRASGFAPGDPAESAILTTLNPGAYTAVMGGVGGTTGVGIVEVFEVDRPDAATIAISTRGKVDAGDNAMIAGFAIDGTSPKTIVVRGRGPSLATQGVTGYLPNPTLELYSSGGLIASNDDWATGPTASALTASGFAPANALEAAIQVTLAPGIYTAVLKGAGTASGIGIVEVFAIAP